VFGDTRVTKINPYLGSNYSVYFDGTGDYLQTPASSITSIIGTSTLSTSSVFTIECWIYQTQRQTNPIPTVIGDMTPTSFTNYWSFGPNDVGLPALYWFDGAGKTATGNTTIPLNTWTHIAIVIDTSTIKMFVNGTLQTLTGTTTLTSTSGSTGYLTTGQWDNGGTATGFYGYISNLRIVKSALYSTSFTPSTTPLTAVSNTGLLICQSNGFKDNSTNNFALTSAGDARVDQFNPFTTSINTSYGSGYFDGTGDWIIAPSPSTSYNLGAGDFTVECWAYPSSADLTYGRYIFGNSQDGSVTGWGLNIQRSSGPHGVFFTINNSIVASSGAISVKTNAWNHIAVVRSGSSSNNLKIYLDGNSIAQATYTTNETTNLPIAIGGTSLASPYLMQGYISNARFVKGTAVYTGNFTPPIAPLLPMGTASLYSNTANVNTTFPSANTSLLTLQTSRPHNNSAFLDNSSYNNLITKFGVATQGSFSPYGSNWSNYFDGNGDYLTVPDNAALNFPTGDFTIEMWIYPVTNGQILGKDGAYSVAFPQYDLNITAGNKLQFSAGAGNQASTPSTQYVGTTDVTYNVWHHIAAVRTGSTIKVFLDGNQEVSTAQVQAMVSGGRTLDIALNRAASFLYWTGYISNFRIVKGDAVYIGNFTPPTAPLLPFGTNAIYQNTANVNTTFPAANTSLLICQSNRLKDNSPNNFAITKAGDVTIQKFSPFEPTPPFSNSTQYTSSSIQGGSAYLGATLTDYLSIPADPRFTLGTADHTIEWWQYIPTDYFASGYSTQWTYASSATQQATNNYYFALGTAGGGGIGVLLGASGSWGINISGSTSLLPYIGRWIHIAISRQGNTFRLFLDGVLFGSGTYAATIAAQGSAMFLGRDGAGSYGGGYYSDFRIVKGTAVYTGNFTPPIAPLLPYGTSTTYTSSANINTTFPATNTVLLCNFTDAAIKDYSGTNDLELVGNVRLVSNVSKYGGTAIYIEGTTGNHLKVQQKYRMPGTVATSASNSMIMGTGNITAEMWVYPLAMAAGTSYSLFTLGSEATNRYTAFIQNGQIKTNYYGAATANIGGNVQPNVWSHVAIVRNGSNINGYVNGVRLPNTETNSSFIGNGGANIGADSSGASVFFGYIDDVRITNGNVRYTANFNVPNQLVIP